MIFPVKVWHFFAIAVLWQIETAALAQELTVRELLEKCLAMQKRTDCISYSCSLRAGKIPQGATESRSGTDYHLRRQGNLIDFSYTKFSPRSGKQTNLVIEGRYVISEDFSAGYAADNQMRERTSAGSFGTTALEDKRKRFLQEGNSSSLLDGYLPHPELKRVAEVMLENGGANLVAGETIDGVECKIVEAKTKNGTMKLWLAPESGYLPLRTEIRQSGDDVAPDGTRVVDVRMNNGKSLQEGVMLVTISKFELIGDAFVPSAGRYNLTLRYTDGSTGPPSDSRYERKEITLDPDFSNTSAFQISFPEGAPIRNLDDLNSGVEYEWRNGKPVAVVPVPPVQKPGAK